MPPTSAASKPPAAPCLFIDRCDEPGFHGSDLRAMSPFAYRCVGKFAGSRAPPQSAAAWAGSRRLRCALRATEFFAPG